MITLNTNIKNVNFAKIIAGTITNVNFISMAGIMFLL